ncbi:LysM peptidoglycan-binding domain-containing protein [Mariprofundus ferrooxydans]|nr:LysM peptidoglycan-binding domain-containing protein [Mariprofundus ferrooxydans]
MKFRHILLAGLITMLMIPIVSVQAAATAAPAGIANIKPDLPQPYIVKKGDTLWDIANYFFKDPMQWLRIWEKNLYITNPDLIYPGNKIWFDPNHQSGLTTVRPMPQVIIRPVERLAANTDSAMLLTALERQDFILPEQEQGVGHILASPDERLNFGAHDRVYLKLNQPATPGTLFDVFRTTDAINDPQTGEKIGLLVEHMGQVRVESEAKNGIERAVVTRAFAEMSRGDRLKPARTIDPHLRPMPPTQKLSGDIIYIRNGAHEAAQNQVVGISIGQEQGLKTGTQLSIMRAGRIIADKVSGSPVQLPQEKVGDLLVLVAQPRVSIGLITASTAPINIGDTVFGEPAR